MAVKPKLLVIEDDEGLRSQYRWAFPSFEVVMAGARPSGMAMVRKEYPPVVILDLGLPPDPDGVSEGMATLDEILRIVPATKVIVVTGNGEHRTALKAVSLGAYDFCEKPVELEVLRTIVERGLNLHRLEDENRRLAAMPARSAIERIITANQEMLKLCRDVEKLAMTHVPVLLLGESGTGKEVLARALHDLGPRAKRPFVAINCGAIPENLLESELFGHERGAFTGAVKQTIGKIEQCESRHAVPRRNRRHAAPAAGEAAALPPGPGDRTHRRAAADPGRCADRVRDQREPRGTGQRGHVP